MTSEPLQFTDVPDPDSHDDAEPQLEPVQGFGSRRRYGRVRIENLRCSLGTVVDLSAGGMRVITSKLSAKKTGERITVELNSSRHSVRLSAQLTWGERIGFRKHIVGLRFCDLSEEERRKIGLIARAYAIRVGLSA
jgi:predicted SPOUT superfamily RNA methylase MTH1